MLVCKRGIGIHQGQNLLLFQGSSTWLSAARGKVKPRKQALPVHSKVSFLEAEKPVGSMPPPPKRQVTAHQVSTEKVLPEHRKLQQ